MEDLTQTEKDIVSHGLALALSEAPGTIVIAVLATAAEIAHKLNFTDELRAACGRIAATDRMIEERGVVWKSPPVHRSSGSLPVRRKRSKTGSTPIGITT